MASTTTINAWLDELALSLTVNVSSAKWKHKRILDAFRRRVKHHNYARTNQFEVEERLTGLEEKFQILNHDELSDELYQRRNELRAFQHKWLPDVLDLLLKLSGNPTENKKLLELYTVDPRPATPPALTWKDLQAHSPVNTQDKLWRVPTFGDYSSDEENWTGSSAHSSPEGKNNLKSTGTENVPIRENAFFIPESNYLHATNDIQERIDSHDDSVTSVSELQVVREILFLLRGLPAPLLENDGTDSGLLSQLSIEGVTETVLRPLLDRARFMRCQSDIVQRWITEPSIDDFIQILKQKSEVTLRSFYSFVDSMQDQLLNPHGKQSVSVLKTIDETEGASKNIISLAQFIYEVHQLDAISCLEKLYETLIVKQQCCHDEEYHLLGSMFCSAFEKYFRPLWLWFAYGKLENRHSWLFVTKNNGTQKPSDLWHHWYTVDVSTHKRPPAFLQGMVDMIFTSGKTAAFLHHLNPSQYEFDNDNNNPQQITEAIHSIVQDPFNPFAPTFEVVLKSNILEKLLLHTKKLKHALDANCGFGRTLQAFDCVYLRKDGVGMDFIEGKIFDRIDRCVDSWNDRFLIADMLEELYNSVDHPVDPDSIIVHASYTSSRSMQSRRQSVRILSALAIEYALPWPMANIIPESSMQSYRRISLTLTQIRRTKYVLERIAYVRVQTMPVSEDASAADQKFAQALTSRLLLFVNILYDHLTTRVVWPMTDKMCRDLDRASTFDDMIRVHKAYIDRMEYACLSSLKLKMLKDALVLLLDLCIRFADLVSDPERLHKGDSDDEANSYTSAQSRRRRRRRMAAAAAAAEGSESESEDGYDALGEGYSSFIVLDEDTTVMKEIRKLMTQFTRQMEFFVAGLRGVARGTETLDEFETLAERLSWK